MLSWRFEKFAVCLFCAVCSLSGVCCCCCCLLLSCYYHRSSPLFLLLLNQIIVSFHVPGISFTLWPYICQRTYFHQCNVVFFSFFYSRHSRSTLLSLSLTPCLSRACAGVIRIVCTIFLAPTTQHILFIFHNSFKITLKQTHTHTK